MMLKERLGDGIRHGSATTTLRKELDPPRLW
jgi:hypothetical protein